MVDPWKIGAMAWSLTVLSWLFAPVIGFMVNKLFAYLCVDVERKLKELEINAIPTLKLTMMDVQEQMMRRAAKGKERESDLKTLHKMSKDLKSALYDAEDMLDLVAYHRIEKKVIGDTSIWEKRLRDAARAFLAGCKGRRWFRGCADIARAARMRCSRGLNQLLCRLALRKQSSPHDLEAPGNHPEQTSSGVHAPRSRSWFLPIYNSYRSIFSWLTDVIVVLRSYRDWSYEVAGFKINKKDDGIGLDSFQLTVHRKSLRETMEQIDSVITDFKKSPLLTEQSSSNNLLSVEGKYKESTSDQEIDKMHRSIGQPIFGRREDQESISGLLRNESAGSSSNSTSFSVIGIHGIAGSGKTTLARCVCDHEKIADDKHFDTIIFIPLSKTFRLQDIFCDMLMEITSSEKLKESIEQDGQSRCKDLESPSP